MDRQNAKSTSDAFYHALRKQIETHRMLEENDRWLLAVSGGTDSMAMLHVLCTLQDQLPQLKSLHVAHINHQLRGSESDADAAFVVEQARNLNCPVTCTSLNIPDQARTAGQSLETIARDQRYEALGHIACEHHCHKIALAHNADDQAETILHRILRGSGIRGLAGIPAVRTLPTSASKPVTIVRPLLTSSRDLIEAYLNEQNIAHREDASNQSTQFTRNKIRLELLPQLKQDYNANLNETLIRLGQIAQWNNDFLDQQAKALFREVTVKQTFDSIVFNVDALDRYPEILQTQFFYEALNRLKVPLRNIGYQQLSDILDLLKNDNSVANKCQLPNKVQVTVKSNRLTISLSKSNNTLPMENISVVQLNVPGKTNLTQNPRFLFYTPNQSRPLSALQTDYCNDKRMLQLNALQKSPPSQELIDADRVVGKLTLRCRRAADRFSPLGAAGEKKLGDFMTDAKVPLPQRDRIGLLCDEQGIVWVLGMRIAERVKITDKTQSALSLKMITT